MARVYESAALGAPVGELRSTGTSFTDYLSSWAMGRLGLIADSEVVCCSRSEYVDGFEDIEDRRATVSMWYSDGRRSCGPLAAQILASSANSHQQSASQPLPCDDRGRPQSKSLGEASLRLSDLIVTPVLVSKSGQKERMGSLIIQY